MFFSKTKGRLPQAGFAGCFRVMIEATRLGFKLMAFSPVIQTSNTKVPQMFNDATSRQASAKAPLRVGLIGVTGYAFAYYEELNRLVREGSVQWGAVTIINREAAPEQVRFFESQGIPIYDDYRAMLEAESGRLDWVCVPTAIGWHTRMTVDALTSGLPVLLEKPIAPTLQDVEVIQAVERASGNLVAIGYQHHYSRTTWDIKRRLLDGEIGDIHAIDGICLWPRPHAYYNRNDWAGRQYVGDSWVLDSPLHNAISHVVNLILFFSGANLEARADLLEVEAELYRAKPIQSYDTIRSKVLLDTGITAGVVFSHSTRRMIHPEIRITGTRGCFTWRFDQPHRFETENGIHELETEDQIGLRGQMFQNVLRRINGDPQARICSTEQAKGELKWVNAAQDAVGIADIPEQYRYRHTDSNGDLFDCVEGLDEWAPAAYEKGCWFSDLGVPWAVERGKLELGAYTSFQARTVPAPAPPVAVSCS